MAFLHLYFLVASLFAAVTSKRCEIIRVDKDDDYGTLGTCCVIWDNEYKYKTGRKIIPGILKGLGFGAGVSGFINDSATRNISGGVGGVIGTGILGAPATPAPVAVPAIAPAPVISPPAYTVYPYPRYGPPPYPSDGIRNVMAYYD